MFCVSVYAKETFWKSPHLCIHIQVSYLTPLTGIDAATLDDKGVRLDEAMTTLRQALPSNAVLVGCVIIYRLQL